MNNYLKALKQRIKKKFHWIAVDFGTYTSSDNFTTRTITVWYKHKLNPMSFYVLHIRKSRVFVVVPKTKRKTETKIIRGRLAVRSTTSFWLCGICGHLSNHFDGGIAHHIQ